MVGVLFAYENGNIERVNFHHANRRMRAHLSVEGANHCTGLGYSLWAGEDESSALGMSDMRRCQRGCYHAGLHLNTGRTVFETPSSAENTRT